MGRRKSQKVARGRNPPPPPYDDGFYFAPSVDYDMNMRVVNHMSRHVPARLLENNRFLAAPPLSGKVFKRRRPRTRPKKPLFSHLQDAVNCFAYVREDWRAIGIATAEMQIVENVRKIRLRHWCRQDPDYQEPPPEHVATPPPELYVENLCEMCRDYRAIEEISMVPFAVVVITALAAKGKWNVDMGKAYLQVKLRQPDRRIRACRHHIPNYMNIVERFDKYDTYAIAEYMSGISRETFRDAYTRFLTWCHYEMIEDNHLILTPIDICCRAVKVAVSQWDMNL